MSTQRTDYSISVVYGRVDESLRQEAAAFWLRYGAIPDPGEARRRADELVCVARNAGGEIVGVNTAYVAAYRSAQESYYFYRMFIRPPDRVVALATSLVRSAVGALRERNAPGGPVTGVVLVTENPKLMREGARGILARLGWRHAGRDTRGLDVWQIDFE